MCKHIFLILAAALVAHLMPKQSVYTLQGVARPNSTVEWSPNYSDLNGMIFFQAFGNSILKYENTIVQVDGQAFFHSRGHMPDIYCESDKVCKVVAHLIT
jgi:hypothetical protein